MTLQRKTLIKQLLASPAEKEVKRVRVGSDTLTLPVIHIETQHLLFNPNLGRLVLDPKISRKDRGADEQGLQEEIQAAILAHPETESLRRQIEREEQLEPGLVTNDGVLINGNRRLAVLRKLYPATQRAEFRKMRVAVLPESASAQDLYLLEMSLQMTPETRARYGPITTLVQLRKGIHEHCLDKTDVATAMYEDPAKVDSMLERLELIDEYLAFIGRPKRYDLLEGGSTKGKAEHFITLQNLKSRHGGKPYWEAMQVHVFQLIRAGQTFDDIRALRRWEAEDLLAFGRALVTAGQEAPATAPAADSDLAALAGDLQGISQSVGGDAATAAQLISVPVGPTKPDPARPGYRADPEKDVELKQTLEAVAEVNDRVQDRRAKTRPADLLKIALRKLEAVDLSPPKKAKHKPSLTEVGTLLGNIEKRTATLRAQFDLQAQGPSRSKPTPKKDSRGSSSKQGGESKPKKKKKKKTRAKAKTRTREKASKKSKDKKKRT